MRRVAVVPLDLDLTGEQVGVRALGSDAFHLFDPVLEEAVVAADGGPEGLRPALDALHLRDPELRLVGVHALPDLGNLREHFLAEGHQSVEPGGAPRAVGRPHDVLPQLGHEPGHVVEAGVDVGDDPTTNGSESDPVPPLVAAHIGRETGAVLAAAVVLLVVLVGAVHELADAEQVGDRRVRRRLEPILQHLPVVVAAVVRPVHREDAGASVLLLTAFGGPRVDERLVVEAVLLPLLPEPGAPERLFADLLAGDRVAAELVLPPGPRCREVHDVHLAEAASLELEEVGLRDTSTATVPGLVLELMAVGGVDALERRHGADPVRHDGDRVAALRETDELGARRREVPLPRHVARLGSEARVDDVRQRCDPTVLPRELHGLLVRGHETVRVVEGHRFRSLLAGHYQSHSRFWVLGVA